MGAGAWNRGLNEEKVFSFYPNRSFLGINALIKFQVIVEKRLENFLNFQFFTFNFSENIYFVHFFEWLVQYILLSNTEFPVWHLFLCKNSYSQFV